MQVKSVICICTIINSANGDTGDETGSQYSSESSSSRSSTASFTVSRARHGNNSNDQKNGNSEEKEDKIVGNKDSDSEGDEKLTLAKKLDLLQTSLQKPNSPVLKAPRVETMTERLSKPSSVTRAVAIEKAQSKNVVKSSRQSILPIKIAHQKVPGNPQNEKEVNKLRPTSPLKTVCNSKDKPFQRKPFDIKNIEKVSTLGGDRTTTDNFSRDTIASTIQYTQSPIPGFVQKTEAEGSLATMPSNVPITHGQLRMLARKRQNADHKPVKRLSSAEFVEGISASIYVSEDMKKCLEDPQFILGVPSEEELKEELKQMQESSTSKLLESRDICNSLLGVWKNNIDTHRKLTNTSTQELYDKEFQRPMKIENIFRERFACTHKINKIGITAGTFLTSLNNGTNAPSKPTTVMLSNSRKSPRKVSAEKLLENSCRRYNKSEWKRRLVIFKENNWFISLIVQIMSYRKKNSAQKIPTTCYVFLGAVQRVLTLGFRVTAESCLSIIEQCIEGSQHRENVVYKILHPVLQYAGIRPSEFMSWLKQREFLPSPKHLSDVKKMNRKAYSRASRKFKSKRASTHLLPALNEDEGEEAVRGPHDAGSYPTRSSCKTLLDLKMKSLGSYQSNLGEFVRNFSVSSIGDIGDSDDDGTSVFGSEMDFDESFSDFGDEE